MKSDPSLDLEDYGPRQRARCIALLVSQPSTQSNLITAQPYEGPQADGNQRNVCIDDVAGARHTGQHGCAARITTPEQFRQTQR